MDIIKHLEHGLPIFPQIVGQGGKTADRNLKSPSLIKQAIQAIPKGIPVSAVIFRQAEFRFQNGMDFIQILTAAKIQKDGIFRDRMKALHFFVQSETTCFAGINDTSTLISKKSIVRLSMEENRLLCFALRGKMARRLLFPDMALGLGHDIVAQLVHGMVIFLSRLLS